MEHLDNVVSQDKAVSQAVLEKEDNQVSLDQPDLVDKQAQVDLEARLDFQDHGVRGENLDRGENLVSKIPHNMVAWKACGISK